MSPDILTLLLMPVFALFFPIPIAIAATAVVHLANNFFKLYLVGAQANWPVVARFSLPAAFAAFFLIFSIDPANAG